MRELVHLACGECKRRNYATTKDRKKQAGRIEIKKYCPYCRKHVAHREAK
jgi:large subunit ribosomal protein L33